jgi:hypothetical protein
LKNPITKVRRVTKLALRDFRPNEQTEGGQASAYVNGAGRSIYPREEYDGSDSDTALKTLASELFQSVFKRRLISLLNAVAPRRRNLCHSGP